MIFEQLLKDLKRANQAAKERLAAKYGFPTVAGYEKYLEGQISAEKALSEVKTKPVKKKKAKVEVKKEELPTDMVIAFDTTGSMKSYIGQVRKHVQEVINNMFDTVPDLKLKIVAFGDYCDMKSASEFGKAYQEIELTDDRAKLMQFVQDAKDTGGGDSDEFYELVLHKILNETKWREKSNKAILLIADCDPHSVGYTLHPFVTNAQYDWRKEAKDAAKRGVRVDTLRIIPGTLWYAELSKTTNGSCMDFRNAGETHSLVETATYLSSMSESGIIGAKKLYRKAVERGDEELVGAYKGMAASRGIDLDK